MTAIATDLDEVVRPHRVFDITFPSLDGAVDQDEEWFEYEIDGLARRLRLHDYAAIYDVPGLYESLVYRTLRCRSPEQVGRSLAEAVGAGGGSAADLRVCDLGAGNGIVGELLRRVGVPDLVGIDILPEAAEAAHRDHPDVYDDYVVCDLTDLDRDEERRLSEFAPNCLVTVAALGFGDIPPEAFVRAYNLLAGDGWLALCIKERFLEEDDDSGFGTLVRAMVADGTVDLVQRERYVHRLSIAGEELHYVALIARKRRDVHRPA